MTGVGGNTTPPLQRSGSQVVATVSYPFAEKFKNLRELPSDLSSFHSWSLAQGMDFSTIKSLLEAALPVEVRHELALTGESSISTWVPYAQKILNAAREVLGGPVLYCEFRNLRLASMSVREYFTKLRNLAELCFPEATDLDQKAMEQFLTGFNGDARDKLMKFYFKDLKVKPHELVCKAQGLLQKLEKRPDDKKKPLNTFYKQHHPIEEKASTAKSDNANSEGKKLKAKRFPFKKANDQK